MVLRHSKNAEASQHCVLKNDKTKSVTQRRQSDTNVADKQICTFHFKCCKEQHNIDVFTCILEQFIN